MKIYIISEENLENDLFLLLKKNNIYLKKFKLNINLKEKLNFIDKNVKNYLILVTHKILSRKDNYYLMISQIVRNNNVKFIEVGLKKSNVEETKANSNTLMHGFESKSWKMLEKFFVKELKSE